MAACPSCGLYFRVDAPQGSDWPDAWASRESERAKHSIYERGLALLERETSGRRALDIGSGFGTFLEAASALGWKASGLEPDPEAAGAARGHGLDVRTGRLEDLRTVERFDAVTFWDVLEALPDPAAALRAAANLLAPGGVVLIRTRNAPLHGWVASNLGWLRWFVREPATFHRFGLSRKTLGELFRRCGLEPLWVGNSPLTAGDPYASGRGLGGAGVSMLKGLVSAASRAVEAATCGRALCGPTIWAAAKKPSGRPLVLHVITRLEPGGSAEGTWALARDWKGSCAELALGFGAGSVPGPSGARVARLRHLVRNPSWRDPLAFVELFRLFRRLRPAAVHTHSSKAGFLGRLAARAAAVPKVFHTPHGHVFYGYFGPYRTAFYLALERWCATFTDAFVALTDGEKRESVELGLGRPEQWFVAPSGTPLPELRPADRIAARRELGLAPEAIWVGGLLRLEWVKGPDVFVEAAARLTEDRRLRFFILGEGPMREGLERRLRDLGLEGRFLLPGHKADFWPWLSALDVYVQPSRNEAMGRTLIQAQAAGLPVVASRVCGIPDAAPEGVSSILVPSEDAWALARAIGELASRPDLRAELGRRGREWVRGHGDDGFRRFSPESMHAAHERLYVEFLGPPSQPFRQTSGGEGVRTMTK